MSRKKEELAYELQRIAVNREGYDDTGAYWGAGPDVFIATSADGHDEITVRAKTVAQAREKIAAERARAPDEKRTSSDKLGGNASRKSRYEIRWTNPCDGRAIKIRIIHARDYLSSGSDHVEIESVTPAKAPLPMTETGYRSHFMPALELMNAGGPVTFVTAWLDQEAKGKAWTKAATAKLAPAHEPGAQGDLFSWAEANGEVGKRKSGQRTAPAKSNTAKQARRPAVTPSRRTRKDRDPV